ncbi:MCE family protein [Gordonia pseudamarae]|jgi:phospholipid/cholesterol/gamma-HCH transport system substrate-binding protein|uniref:MCE family protein n=1 Tax=Gordonia pseudamarae TaxID=2831662 RepID=A0ABX6IMY9_9ACTN|nr:MULTISPECIES: MCE family protein [Gordonia]MBD0020823.1 MCE family protein [Gordonia sp. (in: high G+C Gram-positive bacteria)]QHN27852.1 MCE family protein [Gordonia pseudamarae]QHN36734.1 MCE family protein [Gordonia pseudamarae]
MNRRQQATPAPAPRGNPPRRRHSRIATVLTSTAAASALLGGCTFDGINSLPLPGNSGASGQTYRVTVKLTNAQNLVGNSPVKYHNATIGNVRTIGNSGWHAEAVLDLSKDAEIPANVRVKLSQTSIFGSQFIELINPNTTAGATGDTRHDGSILYDGAVLSLEQSSQYPSVEEVLSAVSLVLNGAGLQQLRTVTGELNSVLGGREGDLRSLIPKLRTLVADLSDQRGDIRRAIDSIAALSDRLEKDRDIINRGIDSITPAVEVLNTQQRQLTDMLSAVGRFGDAASTVLDRSNRDTLANLHNLAPVVNKLAESGDNLTEALKIAGTIPFPVTTVQRGVRGDYLNLFLTLDISPEKITTAVIPSYGRQPRVQPRLARDNADPLTAPLRTQQRKGR